MKKMDLMGSLPKRVPRNVSPHTPGRAYPHLVSLVQYLEKQLPDVAHFYQGGFFIGECTKEPRYTQDVDMSILSLSAYTRVKEILEAYGDALQASGIISRYLVKDTASERHSGALSIMRQMALFCFRSTLGSMRLLWTPLLLM